MDQRIAFVAEWRVDGDGTRDAVSDQWQEGVQVDLPLRSGADWELGVPRTRPEAARPCAAGAPARGGAGGVGVRPWFERAFREYGLPRALRTDNGAPFATRGASQLSQLAVWWLKEGIQLDRIDPGHPEQNGRSSGNAAAVEITERFPPPLGISRRARDSHIPTADRR